MILIRTDVARSQSCATNPTSHQFTAKVLISPRRDAGGQPPRLVRAYVAARAASFRIADTHVEAFSPPASACRRCALAAAAQRPKLG